MRKVFLYIIDFVGTLISVGLGVALSILMGNEFIFSSFLQDNIQRWVFGFLSGIIILSFLGAWKIFLASIKSRFTPTVYSGDRR